MTYESLLHGILFMAVDDCRNGTRYDAMDAYRWLTKPGPWLRWICEHLGLDADAGATSVVRLYGPRCERLLADEWKWKQEDAEKRARREAWGAEKLAAKRVKAMAAEERARARTAKENAKRSARRAAKRAATASARERACGAVTDNSGR